MLYRADVWDNVTILDGVRDMTISAHVGLSLKSGGWATHLPMLDKWRTHFLNAASKYPPGFAQTD